MSGSPVRALKALCGQSVWLDNLSRTLIKEGALRRYLEEDGVTGITSNPSILQKAVHGSPHYREDLETLRGRALSAEAAYESLVVEDIRQACDLLRPAYDASGGDDGYVSWEESPALAHDISMSLADEGRLRQLAARENLLVKVPGTPEGVRAFEELIAHGAKVNVTLMFSLGHVHDVFDAYIRGMERLRAAGGDLKAVKAVASVFLSRVDTLVDRKLDAINTPEALGLRGQAAVAMAKVAYQVYKEVFHGPRFAALKAAGGRPQYLLWASTSTKNPAYDDLLYVQPLIGPETINTMPDQTIAAFRDHGEPRFSLEEGVDEAQEVLDRLSRLGIDMDGEVAQTLQGEGVRLFAESFDALLAEVAKGVGEV